MPLAAQWSSAFFFINLIPLSYAAPRGDGGAATAQAVAGIDRAVALVRAHAALGPWHPLAYVEPPPPPEDVARDALALVADGERHSAFFVTILRAAHGLDHPNAAFVRRFIGEANWVAIVARLRLGFEAGGITQLTQWVDLGGVPYVGEEGQAALLDFEPDLLHFAQWPLADGVVLDGGPLAALTGGRLTHHAVATALARARAVVAAADRRAREVRAHGEVRGSDRPSYGVFFRPCRQLAEAVPRLRPGRTLLAAGVTAAGVTAAEVCRPRHPAESPRRVTLPCRPLPALTPEKVEGQAAAGTTIIATTSALTVLPRATPQV